MPCLTVSIVSMHVGFFLFCRHCHSIVHFFLPLNAFMGHDFFVKKHRHNINNIWHDLTKMDNYIFLFNASRRETQNYFKNYYRRYHRNWLVRLPLFYIYFYKYKINFNEFTNRNKKSLRWENWNSRTQPNCTFVLPGCFLLLTLTIIIHHHELHCSTQLLLNSAVWLRINYFWGENIIFFPSSLSWVSSTWIYIGLCQKSWYLW